MIHMYNSRSARAGRGLSRGSIKPFGLYLPLKVEGDMRQGEIRTLCVSSVKYQYCYTTYKWEFKIYAIVRG